MKYLVFFVGVIAFAFNVGKTYSCETIGIEFKDGNKTYTIGNNEKTKDSLKKTLKSLYDINIKFDKKNLEVVIDKDTAKIDYVKNLQKNVKLFKGEGILVITDDNSSQIAINIPSQKSVIYYQCR